jgi:pimeloyl-ACP methyl ester carboxylesterase
MPSPPPEEPLPAARVTPGAAGTSSRGDFALPVLVIQGTADFTTPAPLARSWVDSIRAPHKAFVPLEGGGHFAVFMESEAFLKELVPRVLPLVKDTDSH